MTSLQKGLEVVGEATEADKAENFGRAIAKYDESLLLFQKATKGELRLLLNERDRT
jgi:hypothetical protein